MIQVKSTSGWVDYCHNNNPTNIKDKNGIVLKTGDVVVVLDQKYIDGGIPHEECVIGHYMVVSDQWMKFIRDDKFYVDGWLSVDWTTNKDYTIERTDRFMLPPTSHFRYTGK